MSLLKIAKDKAEADKKAKEDKEASQRKWRDDLDKSLDEISSKVLKGLEEFHNVKTNKGTLKLVKKEVGPIATLNLSKKGSADEIILMVNARIVSGTFDASDDCRNIPYTDPQVIISSQVTYGMYDDINSRNPKFNAYASKLDSVDELLKEVAEYLSPFFSE